MTLDDLLTPLPNVNVGDHYSDAIVGIMDYNFGNPFIEVTTQGLTAIHDGVTRETTDPVAPGELAVATFNFENLAATNPQSKFDSLASLIVNSLRSPDLIAGEEVQDNNGSIRQRGRRRDGHADAPRHGDSSGRRSHLRVARDRPRQRPGRRRAGREHSAGSALPHRPRPLVRRPGRRRRDDPNAVTGSGASTRLLYSPGRIAPDEDAWTSSRKPLAVELSYRGHKLFVIVNHFNSKGGDDPPRGHLQPPAQVSAVQRHQQAHLVADFASAISAADPDANVVVLGDLNDFEFSETVGILEPAGLHDLIDTLPLNQRYSYEFEGNAHVLDHVLFSGPLFARPLVFDPVHVNAEFFDQASDHDPSVARVFLNDAPSVSAGGPTPWTRARARR